MLNNSGPSQNEAYQGIGGYQYGQGMASTLNGQQTGYANHNQKRPGAPLMQQGLQSNLGTARQSNQRATMQRQFPGQFPAGRTGGQPVTSAPTLAPTMGGMRQGQSALPSQYAGVNPSMVGRVSNGSLGAGGTLNLRAIAQPGAHSSMAPLTSIQGDMSFLSQTQSMQQTNMQYQQQRLSGSADRARGLTPFDMLGGPHAQPGATKGVFQGQAQHAHLQQQQQGGQQPGQQALQPQDMSSFMRPFRNHRRSVLNMRGEPAGDKEAVLNSNDFPALGGISRAANAQGDPASSMTAAFPNLHAANLQHAAAAGAKPAGAKLDSADFPALSGHAGTLATQFAGMHVAGRAAPALGGALDDGQAPRHAGGDDYALAGAPGGLPLDEADKYTLKGLLPLVRGEDLDRNFVALGIDLQALGLNLNSAGALYPSLTSPWVVGGRMGALDAPLPQCYLFDAPPLTPAALSRFTTTSVFFAFYVFAGEEKQLLAAEELHNRGWLFHKVTQVWMKPKSTKKTTSPQFGQGEEGVFEYFDPSTWSVKTREDFFLDFRAIEERPSAAPSQGAADGPGGHSSTGQRSENRFSL